MEGQLDVAAEIAFVVDVAGGAILFSHTYKNHFTF
jgi:hypothetical protein